LGASSLLGRRQDQLDVLAERHHDFTAMTSLIRGAAVALHVRRCAARQQMLVTRDRVIDSCVSSIRCRHVD
jgi:hypothetical protein